MRGLAKLSARGMALRLVALLLSGAVGLRGQVTSIKEYPLPAGLGAGQITAGPDGALWFTEFTVSKIGRITTAGVVTEYSIPTPSCL
jgi:virginiamycin B lyase